MKINFAELTKEDENPANEKGLYKKFEVKRVDGSDARGGKHEGCRYFVLDLDHDQHAKAAMSAYAQSCKATHPKLSEDLQVEFPLPQPIAWIRRRQEDGVIMEILQDSQTEEVSKKYKGDLMAMIGILTIVACVGIAFFLAVHVNEFASGFFISTMVFKGYSWIYKPLDRSIERIWPDNQ